MLLIIYFCFVFPQRRERRIRRRQSDDVDRRGQFSGRGGHGAPERRHERQRDQRRRRRWRDRQPRVRAPVAAQPTKHRVDAPPAGRVRPTRVQALRVGQQAQPRAQQPQHDRGQRHNVSVNLIVTS